MSIRKRVLSFKFALRGVRELFKTQPNARFHLLAGVAVTAAGLYFQISSLEWVGVILCMTLVISLEAINTALEQLTDLVSPEYHPLAGKAKDTAAAAVLVAAIGAVIVGLVIFLPKFICWQ